MTIGNYTDQQVKEWMAGKSNAEVAAQAASMGLNSGQIQQAYKLGGKNYTANDINGYAASNGYSFGSNGGLTTAKAPTPAPAPAANPYAGIDAYMAKQLTANPGLTAANYSPDVYGSMYQDASKQFGVNGNFATPGAAYYSNTLNRTITPEEIKDFAATNPSDKQIFEQAARLGWDAGTVTSAMKSAGMDMSDPKYTDGRAYRMEDSLWRGADGYSVGNGVGGHQAGNGAIVAGGGNYSVDDGNGSSHWASNGPTQANGYGGTGGGYTTNGQVGVNAPDAYNPTKAYVPANADGVATNSFAGPQAGSSANLGMGNRQYQNYQSGGGNLGIGSSGSSSSSSGSSGGLNPYLDQMAGSITNQMQDNYSNSIAPANRSGAMVAGGFGGSRQGVIDSNSAKTQSQALGNSLANLYGTGWQNAQQNNLQNKSLDNSYALGVASNNLGFANLDSNNAQFGANYGLNVLDSQNKWATNGVNATTNMQNTPTNYATMFNNNQNAIAGQGGTSTNSQTNQGNPWLGALGGVQLANQWLK